MNSSFWREFYGPSHVSPWGRFRSIGWKRLLAEIGLLCGFALASSWLVSR